MLRCCACLSLTLLTCGVIGCRTQAPAATSHSAPEKPKQESELAFITISKKAYQSLGIQTQAIKSRPVQERLTLTGWIMAKPGHEVTMTAPAAGYVRLAKGQTRAPTAGERVSADQELLILEPVLTPVDQIQLAALKRGVQGELAKAKSSVQTATAEHQRLRDLHAQKLRSEQDVEQAQNVLQHAKEDLAAAQDKLKLFVTSNISLRAPRAGAVLALHASPGQYVAAAAPVVTVIDMQPVWVRVPVPEFDLPNVVADENVAVTLRQTSEVYKTSEVYPARPAGRVAQVDSLRHTADFWYELETTKATPAFFKDQMVSVHMPMGKKQPAIVAPYAAVVFDTHANGWLYLDRTEANDKQHRFVRQRVQLGPPVEDGLIIRADLADGERVVTSGAAALFSREFHKTPVADEDDD